jgi:hypothetical protein
MKIWKSNSKGKVVPVLAMKVYVGMGVQFYPVLTLVLSIGSSKGNVVPVYAMKIYVGLGG